MKVVQIPNYGPVSFPDSMADDEIKQRAAALANAAISRGTYTPDYRDQGLGSLAASGFKRAASSLGSTITDTLPALAGSALGFDSYAKEQLAEAAEKRKQSEMENPTAYKSYKDVRGVGDVPGFVAETIGEFGPDILGLLTGAGAGAVAGKKIATKGVEKLATDKAAETIAKRGLTGEAADAYATRLAERAVTQAGAKGAERGVLAGMYGSSVGLNAPDTFESIFEKTGNLEPGIALAFGAAQGVLDTYLPAKILKQLSPSAKDRLAVEILNRSTVVPQSAKLAVTKALGTTVAGEAGTEGLQEVLGILAEQTAGAKGSVLDPENLDRIINASIKGAIGGGTFGAPGAIVEGRRTAALSRDEADRRAEAAGEATAAQTSLPAEIDYTRPAFERRTGGPQADLFPNELAKAKFSMDDVARPTTDNKGASYTEALDAAKTKLNRGAELTQAEAQMLQDAGEMDSVKLAKANIAPAEDVAPTIDERQMSLPGMGSMQRPDRQAAAEEGFLSQQPDLLGDMLPERAAAPAEVDPMEQRVVALTQEFIDGGMAPKDAVVKAYQQARTELQDDNLASLQREPADPRQGALQFAEPAPEGRGFREEPFNTQMADQLGPQVERDAAFRQAEQEAAAQKEREVAAAENQRELQLAEPSEPEAPAPAPVVREPVQESFPGMGVRYGDKVRAEREAAKTEAATNKTPDAVSGVVTQDMLTGFGVLPAAPLRKRLVGKDLSNPTQRAQVQRELTAYSTNETVPAESRTKVTQALQSPLFMGQSEMFGPKGGATAAATGKKETPRAELKPVEPITPDAGEGVSVSSRPAKAEAPAGTVPSGDGRVDVPASRAGQTGVRKEQKLTPVKTTKFAPVELVSEGKPAPKVEAKPEAKPKGKPVATLTDEGTKPKAKPDTAPEPKAEKPVEKVVEKKAEAKPEPKKEAAPKAEKPVEKKTEPEAKTVEEKAGKVAAKELKRVANVGYAADKNDVNEADINKAESTKKEAKPSKEAQAAKTYFSKVPRTIDALRNMAFNLVDKTPRYRQAPGESAAEAEFFKGMDYKAAQLAEKWVRDNLDADSVKALDKMIAEYQKQFSAAEAGLAKHNTDQQFIRTYLNPEGPLELSEVDSMAMPLHPAIADLLSSGDVQGALRLTAEYYGGTIGKLASALARAGIAPKVVLKENLTNESGQRVPGMYDPKTNTVFLDPATGMNTHVFLHEVGHAATAYTIANPAHPLTKQLQQLFDDVKGSLDTAYGAESLDEFTAEAWSNESFRAKLNAINPKGEKITALQRFTNSVKNFFRKLIGLEPQRIETALDKADQVIEAMLSPTPELRDAPILYAAAVNPKSPVVASWLDSAADIAAKLPYMTEERADKLHGFFKNTATSTMRSLGLSTLPLHALVDVAKNYLPSAPQVNRVVEEKSGDEYTRNQKIEPVVNEAEKWAKDHPKLLDTFNRLVYTSTIDEVDPSVPRETYEKADTKGDKTAERREKLTQKEKLESWDAMQKDFEAIGPAGRQTYRRMRDTYKEIGKEIREAIGARIDMTEMNATEKETVKKEIYARLAERGQIAPYFPLTRNGDFWVSYVAPGRDGKPDTYVSAFETERERERFIAAIEKGGATTAQRFTKLAEMNYRNTPASSFVNGVLKVMDANRVPTEAREQVLRLFLQTLPESSFAQAFQKRKGTLGFSKDAIRAFREKTHSMSRQMSNMKYAAKLTELRDKLFTEAKAAGEGEGTKDNRLQTEYFKELDQRIKFAISPTTNRATQFLSSVGFNYLLGFNVSSAVVNLTQVPLIVLPYLGGKYGFNESQKAIRDAYSIFSRSGFERKVTLLPKEDGKTITAKEDAMPALDNFDFDKVKDKNIKRLETLAEVAAQAGQLNRSMFYDVLEVDGGKSPMQVLNAASGFMFHHGERMNRQVSLIAAYNLELDRLNKPKAKLDDGTLADTLSAKQKEVYAANQAIYMAEMTNGGTSAASAPRIAQGSVGKVLFMFKRYGVSMYYMMFKMTKEALQKQDPEVRQQAMKQLAGIYGTAAIFSGLQGLPMFGMVAMLYNMFADDDEEDFGTVVRASTNELAYKGLINYMTNLDIAARVGLSDLIFRENSMSSGSASLADTAAEMLGGPVYGVATKIQRGVNMIGDGEVQRGIETMVPTGLGNVMRGIRLGTEGANTLRGDPIVGDVNAWNAFAQMFGFAPADYTKQLEINARLKGIDKSVNEEATKLRRQYNTALRTYDIDGAQDVREKLQKLYDKHPKLGDVNESLAKSKAAYDRQTQLMYHGITISPKMRNELLDLAADLED